MWLREDVYTKAIHLRFFFKNVNDFLKLVFMTVT